MTERERDNETERVTERERDNETERERKSSCVGNARNEDPFLVKKYGMFFTCWEFGEYSEYSSRAPPLPEIETN